MGFLSSLAGTNALKANETKFKKKLNHKYKEKAKS